MVKWPIQIVKSSFSTITWPNKGKPFPKQAVPTGSKQGVKFEPAASGKVVYSTPHSKMHIFDLPEEILHRILLLLPTKELLINVTTVCKKFREMALDPGSHQHVTIWPIQHTPSPTYIAGVANFLRNAKRYFNLPDCRMSLFSVITCVHSISSTQCKLTLWSISIVKQCG